MTLESIVDRVTYKLRQAALAVGYTIGGLALMASVLLYKNEVTQSPIVDPNSQTVGISIVSVKREYVFPLTYRLTEQEDRVYFDGRKSSDVWYEVNGPIRYKIAYIPNLKNPVTEFPNLIDTNEVNGNRIYVVEGKF